MNQTHLQEAMTAIDGVYRAALLEQIEKYGMEYTQALGMTCIVIAAQKYLKTDIANIDEHLKHIHGLIDEVAQNIKLKEKKANG